jgi:hypothetical protein
MAREVEISGSLTRHVGGEHLIKQLRVVRAAFNSFGGEAGHF